MTSTAKMLPLPVTPLSSELLVSTASNLAAHLINVYPCRNVSI